MQGRADAKKVIEATDFDGFAKLEEWRANEAALRKDFDTFSEYYYSFLEP